MAEQGETQGSPMDSSTIGEVRKDRYIDGDGNPIPELRDLPPEDRPPLDPARTEALQAMTVVSFQAMFNILLRRGVITEQEFEIAMQEAEQSLWDRRLINKTSPELARIIDVE